MSFMPYKAKPQNDSKILEKGESAAALTCGPDMGECLAMKLRDNFTCPLELTHDMIKGKWKTIILWRLRMGKTSLSKLNKDIVGISQKMLIEQLNELVEYGLVDKHLFEGYPLRVEYFLTETRGKKMLEALTIMQEIGIGFMLEKGRGDVLREKGVIT